MGRWVLAILQRCGHAGDGSTARAVLLALSQVVTHLCYSDFEDIVGAIHAMDVDVLTIENSRSDDEMVSQVDGVWPTP